MTRSELYTLLAMADAIAFFEYQDFYGVCYALEAAEEEKKEITIALRKFTPSKYFLDARNSPDYMIPRIIEGENEAVNN